MLTLSLDYFNLGSYFFDVIDELWIIHEKFTRDAFQKKPVKFGTLAEKV